MEGYLTTRQAAERLEISAAAVCRLIARGTLPGRFIGGMWLIREESLRLLQSDPAFRARSRARRALLASRENRLQRLLDLREE